MNKIQHPNIMHLYEFLESTNNYYLVIQYCNGGDLEAYLKKKPNNLIPELEALYYLKQIMNAFNVLHTHQIMHRDFKLANIFMHNDIVVVGDFGFAKAGFAMATTNLGTPVTMAPELHLGTVNWTLLRAHITAVLTSGLSEWSSTRCSTETTPSLASQSLKSCLILGPTLVPT